MKGRSALPRGALDAEGSLSGFPVGEDELSSKDPYIHTSTINHSCLVKVTVVQACQSP